MVKVIAISGSPKVHGNTEKLADCFLKGAQSAGAAVTKVLLRKLKYRSCMGCNKCHETGKCVLKDDLAPVFEAQATFDSESYASRLSSTASLIWSATLSGCPSDTDSDVNK